MKKIACFLAVLVLVSEGALAAPCSTKTWADYLALMDCTIGKHTLSDFSFDAQNSDLDAMKITAQPSGLGLLFKLENFKVVNPIAGLTSNKGLLIDFKITDSTGKEPLEAEFLQMKEPLLDNGTAEITDMENGLSVDQGNLMATKMFSPPQPMVTVKAQLTVKTGMNLNASSQIEEFSVRFQAPEPGTFTLLAIGLLPLLWLARARTLGA